MAAVMELTVSSEALAQLEQSILEQIKPYANGSVQSHDLRKVVELFDDPVDAYSLLEIWLPQIYGARSDFNFRRFSADLRRMRSKHASPPTTILLASALDYEKNPCADEQYRPPELRMDLGSMRVARMGTLPRRAGGREVRLEFLTQDALNEVLAREKLETLNGFVSELPDGSIDWDDHEYRQDFFEPPSKAVGR